MRAVTLFGSVSNPITGLPAVNSGGQLGSLALCIDPRLATNRKVYWVFSERVTAGGLKQLPVTQFCKECILIVPTDGVQFFVDQNLVSLNFLNMPHIDNV